MALDMFLDIEGVGGESIDHDHEGQIDILAWSWGMSQSGSMHIGGGGGSGKVNVQDLSTTKVVDKSSPTLMKYCCDGRHFKEATLYVRKAGGDDPIEYVVIKMTNLIISSVSSGGSGAEDMLTENVTFNFEKFEYKYTPQKEDGTPEGAVTCEWDIARNTGNIA